MILCGTHRRHLYFASKLMETGNVVGIIEYKREEMLPQPPNNIDDYLHTLFLRHFIDREEIEKHHFSRSNYTNLSKNQEILTTDSSSLNSSGSIEFIRRCKPDIVFIFGTGLISHEMLNILPRLTINLHLGLSPWYKGAATLFWPFFHLEPQMAGSTFHIVTNRIDAGSIVSQVVPNIVLGDGIHDVGAKAVIKSANEAQKIVTYLKEYGDLPLTEQKGNGKLFLVSDFKPHHLRVIYDLFDNSIVDKYLSGLLPGRDPLLLNLDRLINKDD